MIDMQESEQYKAIKSFIDEKIAPGIMSHGGDVAITNLDNNVLTVTLSGSCGECSVQAYTSEAISNYILDEFPDLDDVIVID